ncbi:MAG: Hsp20/alpha crystallin family protein [Chloroflexi bacterium]|nr:Hsp20/alpha crystallin family protein [Chloroflexota bacterium]
MAEIIRWEPLGPALTLRDAMDSLFEDSFVWPHSFVNRDVTSRLNMLPMDLYETADEAVVNMIVPGVKTEDINLQFQDGQLSIDVNIPAPKLENVTWHYRELGYGQYHREISLPFAINTDKVEAVLQNGYLTLHLPKADEIKPKKIQVKSK